MKRSIHFPAGLATLVLLNLSAHADIVFQASDTNTTVVSNASNNSDSLTITGDTNDGTLLLNNQNGNFNSAGITSTDTIATLYGSPVAATSVVTMTLTIDDITGGIRANGVAFGVTADNTVFGAASDLRIQVRPNNATTQLISGFGTADPITAWAATEASIKDGFTVTLVADIKGYTFSFSDLISTNANPIVDITGTFSGTEFVDNFGPGYLYQTTQKFNLAAATDTTISEASIDVITLPDSDNDGMPDSYEDATAGLDSNFPGDATQGADDGLFDNDGRTNLEEYLTGTDPNIADVDMDDLNDGEEFTEGTNPLVADTDGDLLNDGAEVNGTSNPFKVGHTPGDTPGGIPGEATDPLVADSDGDNLSDFEELDNGNGSITNPNTNDTDGDTLFDNEEVNSGLDPNDPNGDNGASGDPDGDLLVNLDEIIEGTNPHLADTDSDDINDKEEVDGTLNPYQVGHIPGDLPAGAPGARTNPLIADSDYDGLNDFVEVNNANGSITNPNSGDTDEDTFKDLIEIEGGSLPNDFASVPTFPSISWSAQNFDEESDLSTNGTLLFADNFQGADLTLNGIPFTGRMAASGATAFSSPNLQTFLDTSAPPTNVPGFYDDEVPALAPLLSTFWFVGDPNAVNLGITGLTPGKNYLVQLGRVDDRSGGIINRYMMADSFGGGAELDPIGATNLTYGGPDNPAILLTGTFTATSTVQTFLWSQFLDDETLVGSHIPFIQVREVDSLLDVTVTGVRRSGTTAEVDFANLDPAKTYQLIRSADLQDGFPTVVDGPRLPAGATDTFTDSSPLLNKAFYILEETP